MHILVLSLFSVILVGAAAIIIRRKNYLRWLLSVVFGVFSYILVLVCLLNLIFLLHITTSRQPLSLIAGAGVVMIATLSSCMLATYVAPRDKKKRAALVFSVVAAIGSGLMTIQESLRVGYIHSPGELVGGVIGSIIAYHVLTRRSGLRV